MKQRFEDILAECLEAVAQGQRTVEDCLVLYPESAERLEPELRFALHLRQAYGDQEPQADFQAAARERFLSATQARAAHPQEPRRLLPALPALPQWRWHLPRVRFAAGPPSDWRRMAATMTAALLIGFFGFSTFVVASASDSLPGDWRYSIKRLTERTRLTFTFGDDSRRDYRISLAEERLDEVERLAGQERHISESVLRQLIDSTEPLVQALEPNSVPADQIERITDLTAQQQDILGTVAPLVEDNAVEELQQAMVVSSEGHEKAVQALALARSGEPPGGIPGLTTTPGAGTPTAGAGGTPTVEPTPVSSPTPEASPTPEPTAVPIEATPSPGEPTAEPPSPTATPAAPEPERLPLPDDTTGGITWSLLRIGDFSVLVPAPEEEAWVVSILRPGLERETVFVGHRWANRFDAVVTVSVSTGEASVSVLVSGTLVTATLEELPALLPTIDDIILHVAASASVAP